MKTEIYVIDCDNQALGNEIQRLCVLADIKIPETPKLVVEFVRENFGKLPLPIIRKAFDNWIAGRTDIRKPMNMNAHFISSILRNYVDGNRHNISLKPRKMLESPKNEPSEEQKRESLRRLYELTKKQFKEYLDTGIPKLSLLSLHIIGKTIDIDLEDMQRQLAQEWIEEYDKASFEHMKNQRRKAGKDIRTIKYQEPKNLNKDYVTKAYWHYKKVIETA